MTLYIMEAIEKENYKSEVVQFLLAQVANLNVADQFHKTPLNDAIHSHNLEGVKVLIESGIDFNAVCSKPGYRTLHQIKAREAIDSLRYLLPKRADKNLIDTTGIQSYQCGVRMTGA